MYSCPRYSEHRRENYPNVPMTRVETCVLLSVVNLANPKSATYLRCVIGIINL